MSSRNRGAWWIAGRAAIAAIAAGGPEARAGAITIIVLPVPHGDPFYEYNIDVELNPAAPGAPPSKVLNGDSFTIQNLIGITGSTLSNVTSSYSWSYPTIDVTSTSGAGSANVTWAYTGSTPIEDNGPGSISLGTFQILSTYDFPIGQLPYPPGKVITYNWSIDGGVNVGHGQFMFVPEPTSMILLLIGAAVPAAAAFRRRLRRAG